jgi:hypothetical protein
LVEEGTTEAHSVAGAPLAIMPDPVPTEKRTGLGPHFLPGLGSESSVLDSLAECVEANASKGSDRSQHSSRPKKRTGFGPHFLPGLGSESSASNSAPECAAANDSKGSDRSQHSSRPKKRTGFGPHFLPGLGPEPPAFDSAPECAAANDSKGSDRSQHSPRPKKRTGFGPHLCPQIREVSKGFGGYVRSSDILLALLRIPRPETLKEYAPTDLGRIVGLDRLPEVKTLRRKLARLASRKASQAFGRELARRRIAERGRMMGFLCLDGHVRAYHGKHTIPKAYLTRTRLAVPGTTDYWVNDQKGEPLFVVTAEANAAMTRMLVPILEEVRNLIGPRRRVTIVFDRGGWSPKLFQKLLAMGFDIMTYRKGRVRRIAEKRFVLRTAKLDGRPVKYLLHDQPVRFLRGKLRLRQVTRLTDNGKQTPIVTSRWDLRDVVVAYRMFERWRQENFFKYMRQEFLIDALCDYQVEPDDPERSVPNPARKAVDNELRKARVRWNQMKQTYGDASLDYIEGRTPTMREFQAADKKIYQEIQEAAKRVAELAAQQKLLPLRVPLAEARPDQDLVKLSTERKHLTNVLKLVAYQIESDLVNLIRPHYARAEDEGRTLIQTVLQSTATLEPTDQELRVTLSPLSSPHRSQAVAALCENLNTAETRFPGTDLRMKFAVAGYPR